MNKAKIIATLILSVGFYPLLAQASNVAANNSSFLSGPNIILALLAFAQLIAIISVGGYIRKLSGRTDQFIKMRKIREEQNIKPMVLLALFTGFSGMTVAQDGITVAPPTPGMDPNTLILLVLNFVLLLVFVYVVRLLFKSVSWLMPPKPVAENVMQTKTEEKQSTFAKVLTDAVPVEREDEIMLDHEYDGIRELDNNLPPWCVWMFYATMVYAFVYLIYY